MKQFWVDLRKWDRDLATTAIESGADAIFAEDAERVSELGLITTIAPEGDLIPGEDVFEVDITDKESEKEAIACARLGYVVVSTGDWTVIPLENLVAESDRIIAVVHDAAEAEVALSVLEAGVAGVLLKTTSSSVIMEVAALVKGTAGSLDLAPFTITSVTPAGMGDRVCVDTCSLLRDGEGLLVGNTSSVLFLVHAETLENPYVAPRPFRVNAGAVHAYVMMADGRTSYLSELKAGDRVLVSDSTGRTREVTVGRVKIERRPLLVVGAEAGGVKAGLVLQNAETIRLVREDGMAVSVTSLPAGERVMVTAMTGGRHMGIAVTENISEK